MSGRESKESAGSKGSSSRSKSSGQIGEKGESKESAGNKGSSSRSKSSGRVRAQGDQANEVSRTAGNGGSPVALTSPTGITHSSRRPRPPLPPAYPSFPANGSFLAAEQFSKVAEPETHTGSPSRVRGKASITNQSEYVNLSTLNCAPPLNAPQREKVARVVPDVAPFKQTNSSNLLGSTITCNPVGNAEQRKAFASHQPERSAFQQTASFSPGRIRRNPTFDSAKERFIEGTKKVQDTMVNSCLLTRKGQLEDCANGAYDFYRDSCGVGNHRGDDEEFFMNHSSNPQAPDSPKRRQAKSESELRQVDSTEDTIRKRSLRYPEAALVENPDTKHRHLGTDDHSIGEDAASILDIPPPDDNPSALRDYRLSLLFQDDAVTTPVVPLSRLSRALNELDLQDLTVDDLHEELLLSKEVLAKTQGQLKDQDLIAKKQQSAITDLKVKYVAEKQSLHDRLQRESEENSKLQTKLSALQLEVSQLRSNLRSAKCELTKTSNKWMDESRNEVTSRASGRSADFSADDSALVAQLRAEISHLKEQLEGARMYENRSIVSQEYDHDDVMRLKAHLERAEVELIRLKDARVLQATAPDTTTEELRAALAHSENALRIANKKEHLLAEELEDTKAILASHERSSRAHQDESLLEIRDLKQRIVVLENEAEKAHRSAHEALELCRMEADELRSEVQRLLRALDEETNRAHREASERTKERLAFEYKLDKSEEKEKSFAEKIQKLEECLAKAEREAVSQTVVSVDRALKIESDKRAAEKALAEKQIASEIGRLQLDLRSKEGEELMLKAKVKELADKVSNAEAHAAMVKDQAICLTVEAQAKSSELERDLNDLKAQLAEETAHATRTQQEREHFEAELQNVKDRESNLMNEMNALKSRLESAEAKVNDEMFRAEEERRMAVETDNERLQEIHRLKAELRHARVSNATPEAMSKAVFSGDSARESRITTADDSRSFSSSMSGREILAQMKSKIARPNPHSWYDEQPSFVSSSDSSNASMNESISTVPTTNSASPRKAGFTVSLSSSPSLSASRSSPQKVRCRSVTSDSEPLLPDKASPRTRRSCLLTPNRKKHSSQRTHTSSPDSSCASPPSSPPRLTRIGLPPSQVAIPNSVDEADDSSAELLNGIEDIRKIPNRRLDIMQIQRRLIQSTERLTAAKSKLRVLVDACDENREGQNTLKNSVDVVVDRINKQSKQAAEKPTGRQATNLETILCASPDSENSPHLRAMRTMRRTDEVLERYRKYKSTRLHMSPGSSAAIIDDIIDGEEAEI